MIPPTPHPLVLVEWLDAHTVDPWTSFDDLMDHDTMECETVGWLLKEDDKSVVVVPHRTTVLGESQGSGVIEIPRGCVTRVYRLMDPRT